jgi:serine/threonine protein kinase
MLRGGADEAPGDEELFKVIQISNKISANPNPPTTTELCAEAAAGRASVLNLTNCNIDDTAVTELVIPAVHNPAVTELRLTRNAISDAGAEALAAALCEGVMLKYLYINQNDVHEDGILALSSALEVNTALERLDISWNGDIELTTKLDIARKLIRNISAHADEGELHLPSQDLGDGGVMEVLTLLEGNTNIKRLNLSDNDICEQGALAIKTWLESNFTITAVDLDDNYELPDEMGEEIAALVLRNRRLPSLYLQRYLIDSGPPLHLSGTSVVWAASDCRVNARRVALKHTNRQDSMLRELSAGTKLLSAEEVAAIIPVLGFHAPAETVLDLISNRFPEQTNAPKDPSVGCCTPESYSYVLVMELADRSLHDLCAKQRLAGYRVNHVKSLFRELTECVRRVHAALLIHGDLKLRNVVLRVDHTAPSGYSVALCDLDASKNRGDCYAVADKVGSSGYQAPQVAQWVSGATAYPLVATTAHDVWSLGCVLFELSTGKTLFRQDIANDEIVSGNDHSRLHTWHTISDDELGGVFQHANTCEHTVNVTKHLIRWCLKADALERPTVAEMLDHPFFGDKPDDPVLPVHLPMKYRFFISHAQADAASTAKALHSMLCRLGVHSWYDMQQQALTLDGMKAGVRDSDVFLLIMSEAVLTRWFCQQEIMTAIEEGKTIQLLIEEDPRFAPFDVTAWMQRNPSIPAFKADSPEVYKKICDAVDAALPKSLTYRRRDYETDAMLKQICLHAGVALPAAVQQLQPPQSLNSTKHTLVFVICRRGALGDIADLLISALAAAPGITLTEDATLLQSADKVLVLLTEGVLQEARLAQLITVLECDDEMCRDRLVFVCQPQRAGWTFGLHNPDVAAAPDRVQAALNDHEAVTYRALAPQTGSRHEFQAMTDHLLGKLVGKPVAISSITMTPAVVPIKGVRERLEIAERRIAEMETLLAQ